MSINQRHTVCKIRHLSDNHYVQKDKQKHCCQDMLKFMLLKNEIFKRQKKKNTLCHDQILDKQKHPGEFSCLSRI